MFTGDETWPPVFHPAFFSEPGETFGRLDLCPFCGELMIVMHMCGIDVEYDDP